MLKPIFFDETCSMFIKKTNCAKSAITGYRVPVPNTKKPTPPKKPTN